MVRWRITLNVLIMPVLARPANCQCHCVSMDTGMTRCQGRSTGDGSRSRANIVAIVMVLSICAYACSQVGARRLVLAACSFSLWPLWTALTSRRQTCF
ncbi:hypothetical protein LXA43DRAFT_429645 [Ganoderma leucocontextum]|nr:hypothetical protein LXA43DRAFT_429645 [Ganoderma leucocontextum]